MTEDIKDAGAPMHPDAREHLMDLKQVEAALKEKFDDMRKTVIEANDQAKVAGTVANETVAKMEAISEGIEGFSDRLQVLEQRGANAPTEQHTENLGEQFLKTDQFKDLQDGRSNSARMDVKTAIINATGQNQPLVQSDRFNQILTEPNRVLTIRDVIPTGTTSSNLIEYVKENVFTNSAGPQVGGSPEAFENVAKAESAITFTLSSVAVTTLAHFIPASKQVLDDSAQLQNFISGRLMYGLKLYEETQLLLGDNANGELNGLHTQATAYTVQSPQLTNEIDILREMIKQAHVSEYRPEVMILNPQDWYDIEVRKVGSSDDRYVVGNPRQMMSPTLWGLPCIITNSLTSGQAMVCNLTMAAQIFDREMSSVEVSREHSDNFTKNMVTILAEERLALVVYRTAALIKATI